MWEEDAGEEWKAVSDKAEKENKKILFWYVAISYHQGIYSVGEVPLSALL